MNYDGKNISNVITELIHSLNNELDYCKSTPIVGFQFVSLKEEKASNLTWWNFLHPDLEYKYNKAIRDFIKRKDDGTVENTLIFNDPPDEIYWYYSYDDSLFSKNKDALKSLIAEKFDEETITLGSEQALKHSSDVRPKLNYWCQTLENSLNNKGATMWISLPHSRHKNSKVYSSVFVLFSKKVDGDIRRNRIYKKIRDFVIDYLIDLYREKQAEEIGASGDFVNSLTIADFKLKKYKSKSTPDIAQQELITNFENSYYRNDSYLDTLKIRIDHLLESCKKDKRSVFSVNTAQKFFNGDGGIDQFFNLHCGRLYFLFQYIGKNENCERSLKNTLKYYGSQTTIFSDLNAFKSCYLLYDIKRDRRNGTPQLNINLLLTKLSKAEVIYIYKAALILNSSHLTTIQNYVTTHFLT